MALTFLAASATAGVVVAELVTNRRRLTRTRSLYFLFWLPATATSSIVAVLLAAGAIASFLGHVPAGDVVTG